MKKLLLIAIAILAPIALSMPAKAVEPVALTTNNVNLRAGPGTSYPVITTIPAGGQVAIFGCLDGYSWCDVAWDSDRGWVSASYLHVYLEGRPIVVTRAIAPRVGIRVITFDNAYWRTHYVGRPWYRRWRGYSGG